MPLPVIKVASGGLPITQGPAGLGYPCIVSTNGYGLAVTVAASGGMGVSDATPGGGLFSGIQLSGSTFLAGSAAGTSIGTFSVSGGSGTYVFALTDNASNKVQVAGTNGVNLQVGSAASAASSFSITVQTTGGSPNFTQTFLITATPIPPSGGVPTISGSTIIGALLTAATGTWAGSPTITYAYQWKRGGTNVGSNANTYVLAVADYGFTITVTVTATNAGGSASATSAATAVITGVAPVNTSPPIIIGSSIEGQTLSIYFDGTWTGNPTPTLTYIWKRDTTTVGTASSYTLVTADVGGMMTCIVTGTNVVGSSAAVSNTLGPVTGIGAGTLVAPTLDLVSDTGSSSTDNITSDSTPDIDVSWGQIPIAGDILTIKDGSTIIVTHTITSLEAASGTLNLALPPLTDGAHSLTASHASGTNFSPYGTALAITIDSAAPTITTSSTQTTPENGTFSLTLTASETVTWSKTGGTDSAVFSLAGAVLSMSPKDFEAPADSNADNVYVVQVTATDVAGNSATQNINVTVTDVFEAAAMTREAFGAASPYIGGAMYAAVNIGNRQSFAVNVYVAEA